MNCNLAATLKTLRQSILVIGYGNDLCGDKGVGQQVALTVKAWGVPNVRSLAVHQLTPDLATELATADLVIFVDTYSANSEPTVQVYPIELTHSRITTGHTSDPRALLATADAIYNAHLQAWWVMIPASNFERGEPLSPIAERGIADALEEIDYLIRTFNQQIPLTSNR